MQIVTKSINSVAQSCQTLRPHEPQHTRPPCPSPTPGVYPNTFPLSRWCHPTISSSVVPFSSCLQSFPVSGIDEVKIKLPGCPKMQPRASHGLKKKKRFAYKERNCKSLSSSLPCHGPLVSTCALCTCVCGHEPHIIDLHVSFEYNLPGSPVIK